MAASALRVDIVSRRNTPTPPQQLQAANCLINHFKAKKWKTNAKTLEEAWTVSGAADILKSAIQG